MRAAVSVAVVAAPKMYLHLSVTLAFHCGPIVNMCEPIVGPLEPTKNQYGPPRNLIG